MKRRLASSIPAAVLRGWKLTLAAPDGRVVDSFDVIVNADPDNPETDDFDVIVYGCGDVDLESVNMALRDLWKETRGC